jgi:hypothetical protein
VGVVGDAESEAFFDQEVEVGTAATTTLRVTR